MSTKLRDRYHGALLGLACGDAIGTSVEFSARGSFAPVHDMTGGGPFRLQAGQWTDDTSMALCLAESLLTKSGFDAHDQMTRYLNWWQWGYLSATGSCFDIGMTVQGALSRFRADGNPFSGSPDPRSAGNGSLMRLAPVVLFFFPDRGQLIHYAGESSRTTHGAAEAIEACRTLAVLLHGLLSGEPKETLLEKADYHSTEARTAEILTGRFMEKPETAIRGSGYCMESLEAALWCFMKTDSFDAAVLAAANLGDDADTTAAITGQLAGAHYGVSTIRREWRQKLWMREDIEDMAEALYQHAQPEE